MMRENKVYRPGGTVPLSPVELAMEANAITKKRPFGAWDFRGADSRIAGVLCDCPDGGEFELLPKDDPDVIEGGKRYMRCRVCGAFSHL